MISKRPIKVLHVVGAMNRGGTETMLMNIYRHVNKTKMEFDFITYSEDSAHYDKEIEKIGGNIIRLSKTNSLKQHYKIMKEYGPYDVVHSHTLFHCGLANLVAWMAGIKIRIAHAHTTQDNEKGVIRRLYIFMMRVLILLFSTDLLACSHKSGIYLFGEKGVGKKKYQYFPNPILYHEYLPNQDASSESDEREDKSIVIGHIGRFKETKNQIFLLKILKNMRQKGINVTLLLVGDGELRCNIEEQAKKEELLEYVSFTGVRTDIPWVLREMDVFVFPSKYEGLGLVLLEAQASGIPCVVSEAIQPEADMGLGLMTNCLLSDELDVWTEAILQAVGKKETNRLTIENAFASKGNTVDHAILTLTDIYQTRAGDMDEKYSIRVL